MANKFTRNITGTNLGGNKLNQNDKATEPFTTNLQNDLLSDGTDVYVRQAKNEHEESEDKYFCLTDGIKKLNTSNSIIETENIDKNTSRIKPNVATKNDSEQGNVNNRLMTPQRTKEAIEHQVPPIVDGKIAEIPQVDWNETDEESKAFIKNKPEIEGNEVDYISQIAIMRKDSSISNISNKVLGDNNKIFFMNKSLKFFVSNEAHADSNNILDSGGEIDGYVQVLTGNDANYEFSFITESNITNHATGSDMRKTVVRVHIINSRNKDVNVVFASTNDYNFFGLHESVNLPMNNILSFDLISFAIRDDIADVSHLAYKHGSDNISQILMIDNPTILQCFPNSGGAS